MPDEALSNEKYWHVVLSKIIFWSVLFLSTWKMGIQVLLSTVPGPFMATKICVKSNHADFRHHWPPNIIRAILRPWFLPFKGDLGVFWSRRKCPSRTSESLSEAHIMASKVQNSLQKRALVISGGFGLDWYWLNGGLEDPHWAKTVDPKSMNK